MVVKKPRQQHLQQQQQQQQHLQQLQQQQTCAWRGDMSGHRQYYHHHQHPPPQGRGEECEEEGVFCGRRASTTTTISSDTAAVRRFSSTSTTSSATSSSGSVHLLEKNDTIKEGEMVTRSDEPPRSEDTAAETEDDDEPEEEEEKEAESTVPDQKVVVAPAKEVTFAQEIETVIDQQEQATPTESKNHGTSHVRRTSTTMHDASPTGDCDDEAEKIPIWADPIKVRENPTRYEALKKYLCEHNLSFSSSLPLTSPCTFYFSDTSAAKRTPAATTPTTPNNYISAVKPLFDCHTVREFSARWRLYKERRSRPSQLLPSQNLYCFRTGVEPMWEDKVNQNGGRLTMCPTKTAMDEAFEWILCSFVGGNLYDHGLVGLVLARRARGDRIELWLDDSASQGTIPALKERMCSLMPVHHEMINAARFKKHYDK
ncbi:translation initiation factor eIF4E [Apophysomyces sp. BC1021]|nr:translation initiation factor eIF4E [Apophysomyces sp. BC1021]